MIPADPMAGLGPATIIRGDARHLPLADASVDLIVTSPPYFALRSYTDGGEHYDGQIGSEPSVREYVDALLECTREMMRVLKPTGSIFVNLGDKYSTGNSGDSGLAKLGERWAGGGHSDQKAKRRSAPAAGYPPKTRLYIPERYRIACLDELGLIGRAVIIWSKPNGLPESVTDRVRCCHEDWVHLVKQPRYFAAVDEIREPAEAGRGWTWGRRKAAGEPSRRGEQGRVDRTVDGMAPNPLGKLPGSVREVASQPLKAPAHLGVDHFAAFPAAWPAWIIRGWSPTGICHGCSEGRRPISDRLLADAGGARRRSTAGHITSVTGQPDGRVGARLAMTSTITGYACGCSTPDADTRPSIVLDPFGGTGTTAMAARALGRHGISVDYSADYCRLAQWRCTDLDELAAVRGLPRENRRTEPEQANLLDLIEEVAG